MMKAYKNFFDRHNLRAFQSTWLLYVHIVALVGLIYAITDTTLFSKILLTHCIIHNLAALGITAGSHRLWSHKSYEASLPWKVVVMLLNSCKFYFISRCQSRINFPLEQRSQTSPQVLGHRHRSTHDKKRLFLCSLWLALG